MSSAITTRPRPLILDQKAPKQPWVEFCSRGRDHTNYSAAVHAGQFENSTIIDMASVRRTQNDAMVAKRTSYAGYPQLPPSVGASSASNDTFSEACPSDQAAGIISRMRLRSRLRETALSLGFLLSSGCIVDVEDHCTLDDPEQARATCRAHHPNSDFSVNWVCTHSTCGFSPRAQDGCYQEAVLIAQNISPDDDCIYAWVERPDAGVDSWPQTTLGISTSGTGPGTADESGATQTTMPDATGPGGSTTGVDTLTSSTTTPEETATGNEDQGSDADDTADNASDTGDGNCRDHDDCGAGQGGPYCDTTTGTCVQCVLDEHCPGPTNGCGEDNVCHLYDCITNEHCNLPDKPICDPERRECVPCTRVAGQCTDFAACVPETGQCFSKDQVVHVRKGFFQCDPDNTGDTKFKAFCTIELALEKIESEGWKQATIVIASADGPFTEEVHISGEGLELAIIGDDPNLVHLMGTGKASSPALELSDGASLLVSGLRLQDAFEFGFKCTMADVWIEDSVIMSNGRSGIEARDCGIKVHRAVVMSNDEYGVATTRGSLELVNTIIASNGNNASGGGGVECNACDLSGSYVTLADNRGNDYDRQLHCPAPLENARLRNSILVGSGTESIECPGFSIGESVMDSEGFGGSNRYFENPNLQSWFISTNKATPNYRLRNDTEEVERELKAAARRRDGDPRTDIDGTPRPSNDKRDYPGAHIPLPK